MGPFDPLDGQLSVDMAVFADSSDRLVRHLFDVGLNIDSLRGVFDRPDATPDQLRAAGRAIGGLLDDLDTLIRDAGLAMLGVATSQVSANKPRQTVRHRVRRR
jgi:hypothetical protein